jgi:hypothetical protein
MTRHSPQPFLRDDALRREGGRRPQTMPLPSPCNESMECRRAGGCYYCQVIRPFEYRRDREMDAEMLCKRGCSPEYIAAARRVMEMIQ